MILVGGFWMSQKQYQYKVWEEKSAKSGNYTKSQNNERKTQIKEEAKNERNRTKKIKGPRRERSNYLAYQQQNISPQHLVSPTFFNQQVTTTLTKNREYSL